MCEAMGINVKARLTLGDLIACLSEACERLSELLG